MIKRLFLIAMAFFVTAQAQDFDEDALEVAFQELIYDIGMSLVDQNLITDVATAKNALLYIYQNVEQVQQIIDLQIGMDSELIENQTTTIDQLIDFEMNSHEDIVRAGIAWLTAYQQLFIAFVALHPADTSFQSWCDDIEFISSLSDDQEPVGSIYLPLWQASYAVIQAQENFEEALRELE
ncbi:MAG: hypothetical protein JO129_03690 [Candidatus Dependentiae bacterium]|nr:hypothetical protein [Candidatus Dependentiae bacterium]